MTKLCNISCSYNTICHDIPYLILEVSNFIKHKFLLTLAMEFSNRIMLVSTYQYGLATMTYHVETVYVKTYDISIYISLQPWEGLVWVSVVFEFSSCMMRWALGE